MNEELKNQLGELVKKTLELAQRTGQFVIDQAPDLVREFYKWQVFSSIFWMIVSIAVFLLVVYKLNSYLNVDESEYNMKFFRKAIISIWTFFIAGSGVFSIAVFLTSLYKLLFLLIAPKMYLIDYFLN